MFELTGKLAGLVVDGVLQPVRDGLVVAEGLTEGQIRVKAAARLGADVAAGMGTAALLEWWSEAE